VTMSPDSKPRLPSHYYLLYEPPDSKGDEALIFLSERRKVKLKGTSFREFLRHVVPLLDGRHTVAEIEQAATDLFPGREVSAALELLSQQHLLAEGDDLSRANPALAPQLNFFHEVSEKPGEVQQRLARATVSIVGLSGGGSLVAGNLAAAGVGHLRLIDNSAVLETDAYFDPVYHDADAGDTRTGVLQRAIQRRSPLVNVSIDDPPTDNEEALAASVAGSDLLVCCADRGQSALLYKLNRVCSRAAISWMSCTASGFEVVVGPTVRPNKTPCYLCYTMRSVACAENPEDAFGVHRFLDHRKHDDSGQRENLSVTVGLAASLLGLEALKFLTGFAPCATNGAILVADITEMAFKKHVVLRHPGCPVCFGAPVPAKRETESAVESLTAAEHAAASLA